jgi:hypothetical protein
MLLKPSCISCDLGLQVTETIVKLDSHLITGAEAPKLEQLIPLRHQPLQVLLQKRHAVRVALKLRVDLVLKRAHLDGRGVE